MKTAQLAQKPLKTQLCHYQITSVKRNQSEGKKNEGIFLVNEEEEGSCLFPIKVSGSDSICHGSNQAEMMHCSTHATFPFSFQLCYELPS